MTSEDQSEYEETYVHQVYNEIASHFSSTRFKPWPVVDEFLKGLPSYSVGLDIGCGNGKYLTVRKDLFIIASDRSVELLKFATKHPPHSAVVGDILNLPHPDNSFDFAICIAVIHHLSTPQRRREGIKAILNTLRPNSDRGPSRRARTLGIADRDITGTTRPGQALVFVWALEQKSSRRGWDTGMNQDVLVPWVLKGEHDKSRDTNVAAVRSIDGGDGSNDRTATGDVPVTGSPQPVDRDQVRNESATNVHTSVREERTFNRYYHLYRQGELEEDIVAAGGKVVKLGYDRDNWWAIFERDNAA